jgi:hypothetical protein
MKLLICGSRSITSYPVVATIISAMEYRPDEVIHGGARGVDTAAGQWAREHGAYERVFPADWDEHGKAAGMIRNREMVDECDEVLAIWDGKSRGTKHTIDYAKSTGKLTRVIISTEEGWQDAEPVLFSYGRIVKKEAA